MEQELCCGVDRRMVWSCRLMTCGWPGCICEGQVGGGREGLRRERLWTNIVPQEEAPADKD